MITFFRKIRQNLLVENRTGKYLKYALGEIVLIMVGILLAFQVNNWNEERKRGALKNAYKRALIKDLQKDINQLKIDIETTLVDLDNCEAIGHKITNSAFDIDSIMKLYRKEFHFFIYDRRNFNRNTIEALLSSGNIDIFEDSIHDKIMIFNSLQKEVVSSIETELGFYMNYLTQSNLPQIDEVSLIQGGNLDAIWSKIDQGQFVLGFNSVLNSKSIVNKFNLKNRRKLLKETESLLEKLIEVE